MRNLECSPRPDQTHFPGGALCFLGGALLTARARTQSSRLQRPGPSRRMRGWWCCHLPRSVRMTVVRGRGMACQVSCPSQVGRAGAGARAERVHPVRYRRGCAHRRTDPTRPAYRELETAITALFTTLQLMLAQIRGEIRESLRARRFCLAGSDVRESSNFAFSSSDAQSSRNAFPRATTAKLRAVYWRRGGLKPPCAVPPLAGAARHV